MNKVKKLIYKKDQKYFPMELDEVRLVQQSRMLVNKDIFTILSTTPRVFGKRTRFVIGQAALIQEPGLQRGEGMLVGLHYPGNGHMVSMYRCLDGHYIYYDSLDNPPDPCFSVFWQRNGVSTLWVKMVCELTQNEHYGTCAYHSLTFVDFATRVNESDVYAVITAFRRHMRHRPDVKAVLTVERIVEECGGGVNLSMGDSPHSKSALLWGGACRRKEISVFSCGDVLAGKTIIGGAGGVSLSMGDSSGCEAALFWRGVSGRKVSGRYFHTLPSLTSTISKGREGDQSGSHECSLGSGYRGRVKLPPPGLLNYPWKCPQLLRKLFFFFFFFNSRGDSARA
ncbi:uncharacterized protein LOC127001829 [Eriocheir sinensis]|uniref:uncharacterized protein LOC127001829 n=1 Tax=Eriocheir sinensis TaxID=95602 RepID=UPI0021C58F72|nr:uncharacterized protein LOC127001829 [Eriocheir sinensis]